MDYTQIKTKFYDAINEKNRLKFLTNLAILFSSGRVRELFRDDERYIKFWRNHLLKEKGLEGVRRFDENPARPEILGQFIKYVMEQRFELSEDQSVLWAVYLSSLAHQAGDQQYEKLAYGDVREQKFLWNI